VGVIVSSIYFRDGRLLVSYLVFSYLLVVVAALTTEAPFIPPRLLLTRMVLTLACGYGLNMLNRDVLRRLKRSNQRFRMLAENSTDLIALHDVEGKIEYVNPAARRMLGYSESEVKGLNAFSLIYPADRPAAREAYYQQLFLKGESVQLEYRLIRKDGSPIWVEAVGTPMAREGRLPMHIITTSRDATRRKKAEEESLRYQEKLLRINEELDQFSYIVSHDLKSPLRGISNLANFIEEDLEELRQYHTPAEAEQASDELEQHLHLMRTRVKQMEQFIEDVLSFSRAGRVATE
jgi:PAS domain S-box-containing protein